MRHLEKSISNVSQQEGEQQQQQQQQQLIDFFLIHLNS